MANSQTNDIQSCSGCNSNYPGEWKGVKLDRDNPAATFGVLGEFNPNSFLMCWGCDKIYCNNCMEYTASGYCNDCIKTHNLQDWIDGLIADGTLEECEGIDTIVGMTLADIKSGTKVFRMSMVR